jgi:cytochrome b involved in lipid metabolism
MSKMLVIIIGILLALSATYFLFTMTMSSDKAGIANTSSKCLVTINDTEYDMSTFKNKHPGGNVFKCGTDQTLDYKRQHGNNWSRIQREIAK